MSDEQLANIDRLPETAGKGVARLLEPYIPTIQATALNDGKAAFSFSFTLKADGWLHSKLTISRPLKDEDDYYLGEDKQIPLFDSSGKEMS